MNEESLDSEGQDPEDIELTLDNVTHPESIGHLGAIAAKMLNATGCAVFVTDHDGSIVLVNPTRTFFDHTALSAPPGTVPRLVRPVLMDGRPQHVAQLEDGTIWEIEYVPEGDEDAEEED